MTNGSKPPRSVGRTSITGSRPQQAGRRELTLTTLTPPRELPPPKTTELTFDSSNLRRMSDLEQELVAELFSTRPVYLLERSNTGVDVGHWLSQGVLWIAALDNELVLFAQGRRPYVQEIPFAQLQNSVYNHVTGELVLASESGGSVMSVSLPPETGYQVLAQIDQKREESLHA